MDRKSFIKNTILGGAASIAGSKLITQQKAHPQSTYTKLMDQVGFNHLPISTDQNYRKSMKTVLHRSETRGRANHGWLDSRHTFSFANYYNPERMNFGVLRVLNDDYVAPSRGFSTHPHDNMEIISIPLEGNLEHKDSMNNVAVIKKGDVQVMSAGTGVYHSEYNESKTDPVKFLQIWMFPHVKDVTPRYDQITLDEDKMKNQFMQILSPDRDDDGVWVHQNAWFYLGNLESGCDETYRLRSSGNGVYVFVLSGSLDVEDQDLQARDGYGLWDTVEVSIKATSDAQVLLMEVPMSI